MDSFNKTSKGKPPQQDPTRLQQLYALAKSKGAAYVANDLSAMGEGSVTSFGTTLPQHSYA